MRFSSSKTFGHDIGLSCCFRQWRATSHCAQLHGYALAVRLDFTTEKLDGNGWVLDFGSFKTIRTYLEAQFDHATLVATDDPMYHIFEQLDDKKIIRMVPVERTGCEAFAEMIYKVVQKVLDTDQLMATRGVKLLSVEVREHGANGARYER